MKICILCEDSKVEIARENCKKIFPGSSEDKPVQLTVAKIKENLGLTESGHLKIPVSASGQLPATHWFCFMNVTEAGYEKVKSVQEHSIIEESSPKEFLAKWGLQIIK